MTVTRTERGWGAHFVGAMRCGFRRNTLLSDDDRHLIVSTVGAYRPDYPDSGEVGPICKSAGPRFFETFVFVGEHDGPYIDANVCRQIYGDWPWALCWPSAGDIPVGAENDANDMHEAVVRAVTERFDELWAKAVESTL